MIHFVVHEEGDGVVVVEGIKAGQPRIDLPIRRRSATPAGWHALRSLRLESQRDGEVSSAGHARHGSERW
jgi:hypothetical protein